MKKHVLVLHCSGGAEGVFAGIFSAVCRNTFVVPFEDGKAIYLEKLVKVTAHAGWLVVTATSSLFSYFSDDGESLFVVCCSKCALTLYGKENYEEAIKLILSSEPNAAKHKEHAQ